MKLAVVFALLAFTSAVSGFPWWLVPIMVASQTPMTKVQLPTCYPLDQPSQPGPPKIDIDCGKCQVEAKIKIALTGKAAHIPACFPKTNTFAPKQCFGGSCWCSTPYGVEIPNTKTKRKGLVCKQKALKGHNCLAHTVTKDFKAKCAGKDYQKVQCLTNGYCWCSMKNGFPVHNTIHNSKLRKTAPKCGAHTGLKFNCGKLLGHVKHPFDKTRYIKCGAGGKAYGCTCPPKTVFNVKEQKCGT